MMFAVAMIKRPGANKKGQDNHGGFKSYIMNNVNPEKRQCRYKKWQHRAMNGAGYRSGDPQCIPVDSKLHKECKDKRK